LQSVAYWRGGLGNTGISLPDEAWVLPVRCCRSAETVHHPTIWGGQVVAFGADRATRLSASKEQERTRRRWSKTLRTPADTSRPSS
jgi:hypothetical protein